MRSLTTIAAAVLLAGCQLPRADRALSSGIGSQAGGSAMGSESSLVGPNNAAGTSSQSATVEETYAFPPATDAPAVTFHARVEDIPAKPADVVPQAPALVSRRSTTTTTLGAHQALAPIIAEARKGWLDDITRYQWICLGAIALGVLGLVHAHGNDKTGYPLCWKLTFAGGVVGLLVPGWIFWGVIACALLLYALQTGPGLAFISAISPPAGAALASVKKEINQ